MWNEQCEDLNKESFDGCSECKIENRWACNYNYSNNK